MSTTGFAQRPGTAVLPKCSIRPKRSPGQAREEMLLFPTKGLRPLRLIRHDRDALPDYAPNSAFQGFRRSARDGRLLRNTGRPPVERHVC